MLGFHDTNKNTFVYEINRNSGASINLSTLTPVNGSSTMPTGYTFRAITEAGAAIYVGGFSGEQGNVYKITVDNTGALTTMTSVVTLPSGEEVTGLLGYLGTYVAIGTSRGLRIAIDETSNNVNFNYLLTTPYKTLSGGYLDINAALRTYSS